MNSFVPDNERTRDGDLADWQAFSLAYYEPIIRALRLLRVSEGDIEDLAHSIPAQDGRARFPGDVPGVSAEAGRGRPAGPLPHLPLPLDPEPRPGRPPRERHRREGSRPGSRRGHDVRGRSAADARPRRPLCPRRAPPGDPGAATALRAERQAALLGLLRGDVPGRRVPRSSRAVPRRAAASLPGVRRPAPRQRADDRQAGFPPLRRGADPARPARGGPAGRAIRGMDDDPPRIARLPVRSPARGLPRDALSRWRDEPRGIDGAGRRSAPRRRPGVRLPGAGAGGPGRRAEHPAGVLPGTPAGGTDRRGRVDALHPAVEPPALLAPGRFACPSRRLPCSGPRVPAGMPPDAHRPEARPSPRRWHGSISSASSRG